MRTQLLIVPAPLTLPGEFQGTVTLRATAEGGAEVLATGAGTQYNRLPPHALDALRDWLCELRGLPSGGGER
ncbi:hypothetical protein GO986_16110 [Deinococcus sp. HMF7620]|uniref:Uncharacterized protein n=1 Tax=Deinococcus arboris TaxID=2682977 RepID=A0A7C9I098_9DEIO|nr:hypothetical protein [Deinococcus arboris]MVN88270.1 hypothetical protein [Deinococcus arboris]